MTPTGPLYLAAAFLALWWLVEPSPSKAANSSQRGPVPVHVCRQQRMLAAAAQPQGSRAAGIAAAVAKPAPLRHQTENATARLFFHSAHQSDVTSNLAPTN